MISLNWRRAHLFAAALSAATLTAPASAIEELKAAAETAVPTQTDAASQIPKTQDLAEPTPDFLRLSADGADRMTLPVQIGGSMPYPFIIDTGSYRSIVSTELARRLSLQELPPVEIVSMAGRETVAAVHLDQLKFGNQVVSNLPALSVAHSDLGSAGLLGLDGLKNKRVMLDFKKGQLSVGKSISGERLPARDRDTIVVMARSKLGQLILVDSKIDGKRVNVILDTGAEVSVGNMALFRSLKQKKLLIPPQTAVIRSVTGQPVEAQFTVVRELQINSVTLSNIPMVFVDAPPFAELDLADKPAMLLGMRMLRMFDRVAIDFGNRHVDFSLPQGSRRDLSSLFLSAL